MRVFVLLLLMVCLVGCITTTQTLPDGTVITTKSIDKAGIESAVIIGQDLYQLYKGTQDGSTKDDTKEAENLANDTAAFDAILASMPDGEVKTKLTALETAFKEATKDGKIDRNDVLKFLNSVEPIVNGMEPSLTKDRLLQLIAVIREQMKN
jgi:hypothetical protein